MEWPGWEGIIFLSLPNSPHGFFSMNPSSIPYNLSSFSKGIREGQMGRYLGSSPPIWLRKGQGDWMQGINERQIERALVFFPNFFSLSPLFLLDADASEKVQEMGVLPLLPTLLAPQSSCTPKVANIIAEVAKNGEAPATWFLHISSSPGNIILLTFGSAILSVNHLKKKNCFIIFSALWVCHTVAV